MMNPLPRMRNRPPAMRAIFILMSMRIVFPDSLCVSFGYSCPDSLRRERAELFRSPGAHETPVQTAKKCPEDNQQSHDDQEREKYTVGEPSFFCEPDADTHLLPVDIRYRSEEHTSELQSRGLISYAVFC